MREMMRDDKEDDEEDGRGGRPGCAVFILRSAGGYLLTRFFSCHSRTEDLCHQITSESLFLLLQPGCGVMMYQQPRESYCSSAWT
jgi:hypothetical protein